MKPQGWYRDPYGIHEDRYFSDGHPTKLVRDDTSEAFDPPPPGAPPEPLVQVPSNEPGDKSDLLRADGRAADPADFDQRKAFLAAIDSIAAYGGLN